MTELQPPDWENLRRPFKRLCKAQGIAAVSRYVNASTSSVDRWAKGQAIPRAQARGAIFAFVRYAELGG